MKDGKPSLFHVDSEFCDYKVISKDEGARKEVR